MVYTLFLAFVISGTIHEVQLKAFSRLEECLEVANTIMRNREYMSARCVLTGKPRDQNK